MFFFFFVIFVLAILCGIELHPLNYLLIAGAFFAFHLLFACSADHLPVEWAFASASLVSVFLVVSYIITLYLVMQLTARVRWSSALAGGADLRRAEG